jgi:hypothetical protein
MTVSVGNGRSSVWTADGINRVWGFNYKALSASHLVLEITLLNGSVSFVTSGFSVTGLGNEAGGSVTYPINGDPLANGTLVQVVRTVPYAQPNRIGNQGGFHAKTHEDTFDLIVMQHQQSDRRITHSESYLVTLDAKVDSVSASIGNIGRGDDLFDQLNMPVVMYNNTGEGADGLAKRLLRASHAGAHAGQAISNLHLEVNPIGSGKNGPHSADFGLSIRANKDNWTHTTVPGEIDGINIVNRQGGPEATSFDTSSDGCCILGNYQAIGNTGYHGAFEFAISHINRGTYDITRSIALQGGIIDDFGANPYDLSDPLRWMPNPRSFGYMANSVIGDNDVGFLIQETNGTWKEFANFSSSAGEQFVFKRDGRLQFGNGGGRMALKNQGGHMSFLNATEDTEVVSFFQDGKVQMGFAYLAPQSGFPAPAQGMLFMHGNGNLYFCRDGASWSTVNLTAA